MLNTEIITDLAVEAAQINGLGELSKNTELSYGIVQRYLNVKSSELSKQIGRERGVYITFDCPRDMFDDERALNALYLYGGFGVAGNAEKIRSRTRCRSGKRGHHSRRAGGENGQRRKGDKAVSAVIFQTACMRYDNGGVRNYGHSVGGYRLCGCGQDKALRRHTYRQSRHKLGCKSRNVVSDFHCGNLARRRSWTG